MCLSFLAGGASAPTTDRNLANGCELAEETGLSLDMLFRGPSSRNLHVPTFIHKLPWDVHVGEMCTRGCTRGGGSTCEELGQVSVTF